MLHLSTKMITNDITLSKKYRKGMFTNNSGKNQVLSKTVKQTLPEKFDINKEQFFFYNIHSINVSEKNTNPIKITRNEMKKVIACSNTRLLSLKMCCLK